MRGVAFNRLNQVRYEVVSALELDVDVGPCLLAAHYQAHEAVVRRDSPHSRKHQYPKKYVADSHGLSVADLPILQGVSKSGMFPLAY